jgi:hypothetical protein
MLKSPWNGCQNEEVKLLRSPNGLPPTSDGGEHPVVGIHVYMPGDLAKGLLADRIVGLLKHQGRNAAQAELAGGSATASSDSSNASPTKTSAGCGRIRNSTRGCCHGSDLTASTRCALLCRPH